MADKFRIIHLSGDNAEEKAQTLLNGGSIETPDGGTGTMGENDVVTIPDKTDERLDDHEARISAVEKGSGGSLGGGSGGNLYRHRLACTFEDASTLTFDLYMASSDAIDTVDKIPEIESVLGGFRYAVPEEDDSGTHYYQGGGEISISKELGGIALQGVGIHTNTLEMLPIYKMLYITTITDTVTQKGISKGGSAENPIKIVSTGDTTHANKPFLIQKVDENGVSVGTLVFNENNGTYHASVQSQNISLQAWSNKEEKITNAGVSLGGSEGTVLLKAKKSVSVKINDKAIAFPEKEGTVALVEDQKTALCIADEFTTDLTCTNNGELDIFPVNSMVKLNFVGWVKGSKTNEQKVSINETALCKVYNLGDGSANRLQVWHNLSKYNIDCSTGNLSIIDIFAEGGEIGTCEGGIVIAIVERL